MTEDQILKRRKEATKGRILVGIRDCKSLIKILKNQIEGVNQGFLLPGGSREALIRLWKARIRKHERTISQLRTMLKGNVR